MFHLDIISAFLSTHQIMRVTLSLFSPRKVLDHLLTENMAFANSELYKIPETGGRHINID